MAYLLPNPKRGQNILTTLAQMIEDRGFVLTGDYVPLRSRMETSAVDALKYYTEQELLMTAHCAARNTQLVVLCPKEPKLAVETVRRFMQSYASQRSTHAILVIQDITPYARKEVESCKRFELFTEAFLFRNLTQHVLYVPHRALGADEEAAVLKSLRIEKNKLPSISRRLDPIARYFGWKLNTVVEIKCTPGGTQEPFISYRRVSDE